MKWFSGDETLCSMVSVSRPIDEYLNFLLEVCNTALDIFSQEKKPEPDNLEWVIISMLPAAEVIIKE